MKIPEFQQPYASKRPTEMDNSLKLYRLPEESFQQYVSWSAGSDAPLSLLQFISSHNPVLARRNGLPAEIHSKEVRGIWDLANDERWKVVIARVEQGFSPSKKHRVGRSTAEIIDHLRRHTNTGLDLVIMAEQRIYILEKAVLTDRLSK